MSEKVISDIPREYDIPEEDLIWMFNEVHNTPQEFIRNYGFDLRELWISVKPENRRRLVIAFLKCSPRVINGASIRYYQSEKGKASNKRHNSKRRILGFIQLNKHFEGSEAHHIDTEHVIYIPKCTHQSIRHNLQTGEGMEEINKEANDFLDGTA